MPTEQQWTSAKARARLYGSLREYFARSGFLEVETPVMVPLPGLEPHIDPFEVKGRYLHTSPEYAMKRLLADADAPPLFQICKVFRDEPPSVTHNPEFTMLEFYRPHADYRAIMEDLEGALSHAAQGQGVFAKAPFERLTVHEAMLKHAGVDWRTLKPRPGDTWDDTFFRIFLDQVEPKLGHERPVFLCEYPASMASLARLKPSDPTVAERVELYANGVELANGFSELVDAKEQRARLVDEQRQRREAGRPAFELDERFLEALGRMPASAGIAVGLDRVLMLLTRMSSVSDVLLFPAAEFPPAR